MDWLIIHSLLNHAHAVPLATFPRRSTPSLISASAESSRSVRAAATVSMESKIITAKKKEKFPESLLDFAKMTRFVPYKSG